MTEPPAPLPEPPNRASPWGVVLLLLAILPYLVLMTALLSLQPDDMNPGSGEDRIGDAIAQAVTILLCGAIWTGLGLALFLGARQGGVKRGRGGVAALVWAGSLGATALAIGGIFTLPGGLLFLVPGLMAPAVGLLALLACLPEWRARVPAALFMPGLPVLVAAIAVAVLPLTIVDRMTAPGRLARFNAARDAKYAREAAEATRQMQQEEARFNSLGPDSSLRDYMNRIYGVGMDGQAYFDQAMAGARRVKSRQADAIALLGEGRIRGLAYLWQLDLDPNAALCAAYDQALRRQAAPDREGMDWNIAEELERQIPNILWLRGAGCTLDEAVRLITARMRKVINAMGPQDPSRERWQKPVDTLEGK